MSPSPFMSKSVRPTDKRSHIKPFDARQMNLTAVQRNIQFDEEPETERDMKAAHDRPSSVIKGTFRRFPQPVNTQDGQMP